MKKLIIVTALVLVAAIASASDSADEATGAIRAVELAARAAPASVNVVLAMDIKAAGRSQRGLHLNSEEDYRDQRNVTIDIAPAAENEFKQTLGDDWENQLIGKRIKVRGKLRRVTVWFYENGKKTDKFYYQTHLAVSGSDQILAMK